jgi:hypothetical protein
MRHRFIGGALLATAALLAGTGTVRAQVREDQGGLNPPLNSEPTIPIPTGQAGQCGFYTAFEYIMLTQTRALGDQTIAFRGLIDSTGRITGVPGTFIGSANNGAPPALTTDMIGRTTFQPGWRVELGYSFDEGLRVYGNFLQLIDAHSSAGATAVPPFFRSQPNLSDTFLTAGVYNFPPAFAGPVVKTGFDQAIGGQSSNTYGIWNGATTMDIKFTERFTQGEIGARLPILQTDYSRVYGLAGGRYDWFFERFWWRTVSFALNGIANPTDAANYVNTLSQRLYGPFVGCGHEIFLANQFSLSVDLTAAVLLGVNKYRTKYSLGDSVDAAAAFEGPVTSKAGRVDFAVVPNFNGTLNLWWYPIEGVQMRVGYNAMTFFATRAMRDPVGFNFDAIDPVYDTRAFRLVHGFNVGIGFFF